MNMKLLEVITPRSFYHGCSTQKTLWEKNVTLGELTSMKMKNYGPLNVRKQMEIKGSDKYITLDISLRFDIMEKMKIISS